MTTATALPIPSGSEQNASQTLSVQPANGNMTAKKQTIQLEKKDDTKNVSSSFDEQKQTTATFQDALTNTIQKKLTPEKTEKEKAAKKDNPLSDAVEQLLTAQRPIENVLSAPPAPSLKNIKNANSINSTPAKSHFSSDPLKITLSRPHKSIATVGDTGSHTNNAEDPIRQKSANHAVTVIAPAAAAAQPAATSGQRAATNQPLPAANTAFAAKPLPSSPSSKNAASENAALSEKSAPLKTQKIKPISFGNFVQQSQIKAPANPQPTDNSASLEQLENASGTTKTYASSNSLKAQAAQNLSKTKTVDAEKPAFPTVINSSAVAPAGPYHSATDIMQSAPAVLQTNSSVKPAIRSPIDQIVSHLQMRSLPLEHQIRLVLSPAELGAIRLTFTQMDGQIAGLIEVQNEQTRAELQQLFGQLTAALESAGLTFARLEVAGWDNSTPSNLSSSQDDQSPRRHFEQTPDFLFPADYRETVENAFQDNTPLADFEKTDVSVSDGLNLYI